MPARTILLCLAAATALAGLLASVALAAGNYKGDARGIALTAREAKYKVLVGSGAAPAPAAHMRQGYRSGWQTSYLKGTVAKPIEAFAVVYVYKTPNDARVAYVNSCTKGCSKDVMLQQVVMKYSTRTPQAPSVVATCRNLYVVTVVSGKVKASSLVQQAGALAGTIFSKAASQGMTPCVK